MLDQLYVDPLVLERHRAAPLFEERCSFLAYQAQRRLCRRTLRRVAQMLIVVTKVLRLADRSNEAVSRDEILQITRPRDPLRSLALLWLRFMGRLQELVPDASLHAVEIQAFVEYMRHERGFSEDTIRSRNWLLPELLGRLDIGNGSLHLVTPGHIDVVLKELLDCGAYSRTTVRDWAGELRVFFRFAESRGWCRSGLADSVRGPRIYSQASLPVGPSWDDVQRLLALTEGDWPCDIRDRAILMLFAVYGLRSSEVKRLRLDDLDWEHETLNIAISKSGRPRSCPLDRTVGDAILRYLKEVRPPSKYREVFLSLHAPFGPVRYVYSIVAKRLRLLKVSLPHYGPHALRHACATRLLDRGLSLYEIGDHLGHQDPDSTRIYAKVDLNGLREVADFDLGGVL